MTIDASKQPGFSNNYLVHFRDEGPFTDGRSFGAIIDGRTISSDKYVTWRNPVWEKWHYEACTLNVDVDVTFKAGRCVQLYIPGQDEALTQVFREQIQVFSTNVEAFVNDNPDSFTHVCSFLDTKDVVIFSEVSKGCYLAAKMDTLWISKLRNLVPNVHCLPHELCPFTKRQQIQIMCKHISEHQKPYRIQYDHNVERVQWIQDDIAWALLKDPQFGHYIVSDLKLYLKRLVGEHYNGTLESISPDSAQGRCLFALQDIPHYFDNQDKFEELIQLTAVAKQNPVPMVEEVVEDTFNNELYFNEVYFIDLTVTLDVGFGNSLMICGQGGDLSWDLAEAIPLTCEGGNQWKTFIPSDVKEFKIVLKRKDGSMHWEKGKNRFLGNAMFHDIKKIQF